MKHRRGAGANLDNAYLKDYSRYHVLYEIRMFFCSGKMLCDATLVARNSDQLEVVTNAMIESFVLHLRNVLDFFYGKAEDEHKDDVTARMYYDDAKLPMTFPRKPKVLNQAHIRAHKEMSHLTAQRLPPDDPRKAWNFRELMTAMKPLIREFVNTASRAKLHDEFLQHTGDLLQSLDQCGI